MTEDEKAELFSKVCDVIERTYQEVPLDDDSGWLLTSKAARAGAIRIFEILGVEW